MYKELTSSREILADLVFEMKEFTEEELDQRVKDMFVGMTDTGRRRTVHDFLDDLRELGTLSFESGRYHLQKFRSVFS